MKGRVGFKKEGEKYGREGKKVINLSWKADGIGEVKGVGFKWKGREGKKASD